MVKRFISPRLVLASVAFAVAVVAATAPVTVSPETGFEVSSACGSALTTCCEEPMNACSGSGAGVGWYDSGCYGPCGDLHHCVWENK